MDPNYEQRLRDEVLYLHSLWHQGPPRNPYPKHTSSRSFPSQDSLPIIDSLPSKSRKRSRGSRGRKGKKNLTPSNPQPDSGAEWPCPPLVENPVTESGWPAVEINSGPVAQPVSVEERTRLAALHLQQKVLDACQKFFVGSAHSGRDGDDENDEEKGDIEADDDDEDEDDDDVSEESKEYKFLFSVFLGNIELRNYYEKNPEAGVFCCLVCGGGRKKSSGRRFKSCIGLLQHSIAITKAKKRRAHRAFGQVICRVLGWDFDKLPIIVSKGVPLGRSLAHTRKLEGHPEGNASINEHVSDVFNENAVSVSSNDNHHDSITPPNDDKNPIESVNEENGELIDVKSAYDPQDSELNLVENSPREDDAKANIPTTINVDGMENSGNLGGKQEGNADSNEQVSGVLDEATDYVNKDECKNVNLINMESHKDNLNSVSVNSGGLVEIKTADSDEKLIAGENSVKEDNTQSEPILSGTSNKNIQSEVVDTTAKPDELQAESGENAGSSFVGYSDILNLYSDL